MSAAELRLKNEGPGEPQIFLEMNQAGDLYLELSQWDRATSCFQRSLGMARETTLDTDQPIVALLLNLSNVELRQKRFAQALPYLCEALLICKRDPDRLSREYEAVLRRLTESLVMTDHFDEAETICLRWLAFLDQHALNDEPALPAALANLAMTYQGLQQPEAALRLLERAIPLVERCAGPNAPGLANYFHTQADILTTLGRLPEALELTDIFTMFAKVSLECRLGLSCLVGSGCVC